MGQPSVFRLFLLALVVLGLFACAQVVRPVDQFPVASDDFAKRLRWLDYSGAALHLAEGVRPDFLDRFGDDEDLRVIDFTLERVEFRDDGRQVVTHHVLEYYMLPSASVKKERIRLEWQYREEHALLPGAWQITSSFPPLP